MNYFDSHGWLTMQEIPGRMGSDDVPSHGEAPVVGELWPNWHETFWSMDVYSVPTYQSQPTPTYGNKITVNAFMLRFSAIERKAIKAAADSDPDIKDVWDLMNSATYIQLDHPVTIGGMSLIGSKVSSITAYRKNSILQIPVTDPLELPGSVRVYYGLSEVPI